MGRSDCTYLEKSRKAIWPWYIAGFTLFHLVTFWTNRTCITKFGKNYYSFKFSFQSSKENKRNTTDTCKYRFLKYMYEIRDHNVSKKIINASFFQFNTMLKGHNSSKKELCPFNIAFNIFHIKIAESLF